MFQQIVLLRLLYEASLKNIQRVVHPSNSVMIETELEKNISK